jgi:hypothetical protein
VIQATAMPTTLPCKSVSDKVEQTVLNSAAKKRRALFSMLHLQWGAESFEKQKLPKHSNYFVKGSWWNA